MFIAIQSTYAVESATKEKSFDYAYLIRESAVISSFENGDKQQYYFMPFIKALDEIGHQGWELVAKESENRYIIKREITNCNTKRLKELHAAEVERDKYEKALRDILNYWGDLTESYNPWDMLNIALEALGEDPSIFYEYR